MKKILFIAVLFSAALLGLTSCSGTKDPLKLDKLIKEQVVEKTLSKKLKVKPSTLALIPYSFKLDVKGDVGYETYIASKLAVELSGQDAVSIEKIKELKNKKLESLKIAGVSGSVSVTGTISALGMKFDVNEHFNF